MNRDSGTRWPFVLALAALIVVCGVELWCVLAATGDVFAYPLDDAYIHLAMARSLADHGVWGITPHEFSASSSSPLWLAVLAAVRRIGGSVGQSDLLPLAMAFAASTGLLWAVDRSWRGYQVGARVRAIGLVALVFATPLPALVLTGMEHCLHALLVLLFCSQLLTATGGEGGANQRRALGVVWVLAPLMVAARFESLFVVAPAGLLLWWRVGWRPMVVLGSAAALPIVALGIWSWSQGSFILPNSIVMKSGSTPMPGVSAPKGWITGIRTLTRHGHVGLLMVAALFAIWRSGGVRHPAARGLLVFAVALGLHVQFARVGWFYRYEAYLIALGIALVVPSVCQVGRRMSPRVRMWAWILLLACVGAYARRVVRALVDPPAACYHIHRQNVQVARFVAKLGARAVAVNDIGAPSYFSESRIVDLVGLASIDVARARRAGTFDAAFVGRLCAARGVALAVVFESWFPGQLPASWERLATWTVEDPYWEPTVTFFAVDANSAESVRAALAEYSAELPAGVRVD